MVEKKINSCTYCLFSCHLFVTLPVCDGRKVANGGQSSTSGDKTCPLTFKSKVCTQFGFCTLSGKAELDMTKAVSNNNKNCNSRYYPIAIFEEMQIKSNRHWSILLQSIQDQRILSKPYFLAWNFCNDAGWICNI